MYKIFLSLLVFVQVAAYAQTGTLKGIASDSTNSEALIGAVVSVVDNNAIGGVTDIDGSFVIEGIPAGTYNFKISYLGYKDRMIEGVSIQSGQTTDLGALTMSVDNANDLTEVTVIGVKEKASEAAVVQEIREADQVVSGISSEQISKGQDRDAAQVVQRIPGVSVVDNRFIMIRGLNDRYNTVWLNDVTAPSLEADRKAFSFDAVPSSIIERVLVYKTPSPELPGDYAGGLVKIYTKTPQRRSFNVGVTLGARNGTTFSPFTKDKSPTDFLGFDSGQRKLPNVPSNANSNLSDADGKKFDNTASTRQTTNAAPDIRIGLNYTNVYDVLSKKLGVITSVNYSNVNTTFAIRRQDSDNSGLIGIRTEKEYTNQARLGAILNFSLILNGNNKLEFRNFFIQNGINQSVDRSIADAQGRVFRKQYTMGYSSRTIYTTQVAGKHEKKNTFFDWTLGYSLSKKSDPDQRRAIYNVDQTTGAESIQPANSGSDINAGTSRFYQNLTENAIVGSANFTQKFKLFNDKLALDLNLGTYLESKSREFKARVFGYTVPNPGSLNYQNNIIHQGVSTIFDPSNVSFANGFSIAEDVKGAYTYQGLNQLSAFYASVNLAFGNLKLLTGVRYENNIQNIKTTSDADEPLNINNTTNYFLPSANLSYNITDRQLVRVAYGKSLNRPEFREKVPFTFYQFATLSALSGNPDLKVASINNYDIRYEFYPTQEEVISVAGFYKDITDAIESVSLNTAQLTYSFQNAHSAYIAGIELEVKKNLGFITERAKDFSLLLNASLIKSEVSLPVQGGFYWNNENKRPLQGQSPYVINAGLYYQNDDKGWSASVLYNIFGPRIVTVGNGNYANVIETPRSTLDATITKTVQRFSITAGAVDIFNQSVIYVQNFSANGNYSRKEGDNSQLMNYRKGNYFTLSVRYNL
ncbi:MAG: TonB-dependent receptor [Chitinophagaceae bacterium]|nr:TonB-dependent receptor [Chitinophagaceae bacterium]